MTGKLLVVDDAQIVCDLLERIFAAEGLTVVVANDGPSGLEKAKTEQPDVVLLDLHLVGLDGLTVLERLKASWPWLPVIMLTYKDEVTAVRATHLGAFDYLTKPVDRDQIVLAVRRALESHALHAEVAQLRRRISHASVENLASQMGSSRPITHVIEQVGMVGASTFAVLVIGETGTGKELVAQAIHRESPRRGKPLIALDCGAIPEPLLESELFGHERGAFTGAERRKEGRLRLAEGGTCFLDEVSNLPMSLQAKLLRVLESPRLQAVGAERDSPMDVRFVAATNDNLHTRVLQGHFRADLYYRLAQYTIALPPLRKRTEDVAYLALRFLTEASLELRRPIQAILPEAIDVLRRHDWPGNVRELRNVIRQLVLEARGLVIRPEANVAALGRTPELSTGAVTPVNASGQSLKEVAENAARAAERRAIVETLQRTRGNKSEAARLLKTDYKTLHVKMRMLEIVSHDFAS